MTDQVKEVLVPIVLGLGVGLITEAASQLLLRLTIPANPITRSEGFRSPVPVIPIARRSEATVNWC
jgi:hypothetical protein